MARFRTLRPRSIAAVVLVACLAAALVVAYARVAPAHAASAGATTPSSVRPCQVYTETDDIPAPSVQNFTGHFNPYDDETYPSPTLGDIWEVYYNLRVDASGTGLLCGMQLVLRITPQDGGKFWGPVEYSVQYHDPNLQFAGDTNQTVYAAAPNHVVTRSAWFAVGHATYTLVSVNSNYSAVEAVGVFTV